MWKIRVPDLFFEVWGASKTAKYQSKKVFASKEMKKFWNHLYEFVILQKRMNYFVYKLLFGSECRGKFDACENLAMVKKKCHYQSTWEYI